VRLLKRFGDAIREQFQATFSGGTSKVRVRLDDWNSKKVRRHLKVTGYPGEYAKQKISRQDLARLSRNKRHENLTQRRKGAKGGGQKVRGEK
jgi:hypothetical protein